MGPLPYTQHNNQNKTIKETPSEYKYIYNYLKGHDHNRRFVWGLKLPNGHTQFKSIVLLGNTVGTIRIRYIFANAFPIKQQ